MGPCYRDASCLRARAALRAVLLGALAILAACSSAGPSSTPFAKFAPGTSTAKATPPVKILAIEGLPADKATAMQLAFAAEAAQRNIPLKEKSATEAVGLRGEFRPQSSAEGTVIAYRWTVTGRGGSLLYTFDGAEPAPAAGSDPLAGLDPVVTRRIAAISAENLSARLGQMGFATQVAGIPPPPDAFVKAGPGAEKDIDFALLHGMTGAPYGRYGDAVRAGRAPSASYNTAATTAAPETPAEPEQPALDPSQSAMNVTPGPDTTQIRSVAVTGVTGAPGKGNAELALAMRRTLEEAGWPVEAQSAAHAIDVSGEVTLGPKGSGLQRVLLTWTVKMPDGEVLGTIKQANDIEPGSLDRGWGDTAYLAAQAASEGIFELVNQVR